ncbi:MAG: hypothetical protein CME70_02325 [Halobacteriovorax sp.]|nr:hypothetical protein [Halobacteriovorax sp.]|tara:strand:- start:53974 stop:54318 length:345 start_codon:yes stop_codon:yes gene_type:complete
MKLAIIILGLFFLSLTVRSRELTLSERTILSGHKTAATVKTFMEAHIKKTDLSMRDYIGFLALRKACDPVNLMIKFIENQKDDYPDQSKKLVPVSSACEKGSLGLAKLYVKQQK